MADVELHPETGREDSWRILIGVAVLLELILVPCMVCFAAALGPFGLGFLGLIALGALGGAGMGVQRLQVAGRQPRPVLTVSTDSFVAGSTIEVGWRFTQGAERVKSVRVEAIARETIEYDGAIDGMVERSDVCRVPIGFGSGPTGGGQLALPKRVMPSFKAGRAKLTWRIQMTGKTDAEDLDQRFDIEVLPC